MYPDVAASMAVGLCAIATICTAVILTYRIIMLRGSEVPALVLNTAFALIVLIYLTAIVLTGIFLKLEGFL